MSEFDKELDKALQAAFAYGHRVAVMRGVAPLYEPSGEIDSIKQAIEKHIIGEDIDASPEGLDIQDVDHVTAEETIRISMSRGMNLEKDIARQKLHQK